MKTFTIEFAKKFKKSYAYKMGGTQTIILNEQKFEFNDKEFYSGRGAKYNSSIKHDLIGNVSVSKKEIKEAVKEDRARAQRIKICLAKEKERITRIEAAKRDGVYSLMQCESGQYVELASDEQVSKTFDATRLANTLKISIEDSLLLNSEGKTYVFAKNENGLTYELYHSSLDCNGLTIWVSVVAAKRIAEFSPAKWQSAPFAREVGQTSSNNHFAC